MSELAPINDINLKIFDEICEKRFSNLELDVILVQLLTIFHPMHYLT